MTIWEANRVETIYNYKNFDLNEGFKKNFGTLMKVGTFMPTHFTLQNLHGQSIATGDLVGKKAIIETASMSCPNYFKNIESMLELERQHPEYDFYVLYVREEHPGENFPSHQSLSQKAACAKKMNSQDSRTILIDDVAGTLHRYMGAYPNSLYVVDHKGKVVFARYWNQPDELEIHLSGLVVTDSNDAPSTTEPTPIQTTTLLKTLFRSGAQATVNYVSSLPKILKQKNEEKSVNCKAKHL